MIIQKDIQGLPVCTTPRFDISGSSLQIDRDVKSLIQNALSVYRINENILKELKPDIIITQSQCDVCAVSEKDVENALEHILGINPLIISLQPKDLGDIREDIKFVANSIGVPNEGAELSEKFERQLEKLKYFKRIKINLPLHALNGLILSCMLGIGYLKWWKSQEG